MFRIVRYDGIGSMGRADLPEIFLNGGKGGSDGYILIVRIRFLYRDANPGFLLVYGDNIVPWNYPEQQDAWHYPGENRYMPLPDPLQGTCIFLTFFTKNTTIKFRNKDISGAGGRAGAKCFSAGPQGIMHYA
jgi:hypothetical protein